MPCPDLAVTRPHHVTPRSRLSVLLLLLLLSGCTAGLTGQIAPPGPAIVYVVDRGWHTDVTVPVEEIPALMRVLERAYPGVRYLSFGFGERQFFMASYSTPAEALSALLPSRSAILMTAIRATPEAAFGAQHVVALRVTRDGIAAIGAAIWQELARSSADAPIALASGPYPGSTFYAARGTYDAVNTCNTWTASVLHAGGLPVASTGILFSSQVMAMARAIAARQASLLSRG